MLKAEIEDRLQDATGLLMADNEALLHLSHAGEPLRMSDLADRLVLSRGGTTKVVTRLEQAGLATRTTNADDRRSAGRDHR
jgi:DNA-binding MarR family transcriptional regulator